MNKIKDNILSDAIEAYFEAEIKNRMLERVIMLLALMDIILIGIIMVIV